MQQQASHNTQRNQEPVRKEKPALRLNSSKPSIELTWWWTCQVQNASWTHHRHQVACNDEMTDGPTAMLWLVQAQKTISQSLDRWLCINWSEIKNKDLVRSSAYQRLPKYERMMVAYSHQICQRGYEITYSSQVFFFWGNLCPYQMVFILEVSTPNLSGCSQIISMRSFSHEDDGQGVARCPSRTFWTVLKLLEFSIFQRSLNL